MKRYGLTMMATVTLAGCSMGQDIASGGAAVDAFHKQYDSAQFAAIDAAAGAEIKGIPGGLAPVLEQIHARLGKVKSTSRIGFNDAVNNGDHRLELQYATKFEKADGNEEFVFRLIDGKPVLIGYHVKSAALNGNYSAAE